MSVITAVSIILLLSCVRNGSSLMVVPSTGKNHRGATTRLFDQKQLNELVLSLSEPQVQPLPGPGFCNELYRVEDSANNNEYVAKIFSIMAKRRRPTASFEIDLMASEQKLGPSIKSCTDDGILMDYLVDGTTLDEATIHGAQANDLLEGIAMQLKRFHSLPVPLGSNNMLWYSLKAMLEDSSSTELKKEYQHLQSQISPLPLPTCLGHGDFKPSNVMLLGPTPALPSIHSPQSTTVQDSIRFIDFELSGLGYRGFDVAKFFRRTDRKQTNEANMEDFLKSYCGDDSNDNNYEVSLLQQEAELLLPLTWFEAAVFFDYALRHDDENSQTWKDLYDDRMASYEMSLSGHEERLKAFRNTMVQEEL